MRHNNQNVLETEVELTAQDLLNPVETHRELEIDDIVAMETTPEKTGAANSDEAHNDDALQETSEIELTAEQMSAMLGGRWP